MTVHQNRQRVVMARDQARACSTILGELARHANVDIGAIEFLRLTNEWLHTWAKIWDKQGIREIEEAMSK